MDMNEMVIEDVRNARGPTSKVLHCTSGVMADTLQSDHPVHDPGGGGGSTVVMLVIQPVQMARSLSALSPISLRPT